MSRFFVPCEDAYPEHPTVDKDLAQHFRALRVRHGEVVSLFNGRGQLADAVLTLQRNGRETQYRLSVVSQRLTSCEQQVQIHVFQSILPQDRMDFVIEKLTELGVSRLTPLLTERTNTRPTGEQIYKRMQHWHRVMINSCEQSGRNHLMLIDKPLTLAKWLSDHNSNSDFSNSFNWLLSLPASRAQNSLADWISGMTASLKERPSPICLVVGPEGGLTQLEINGLVGLGFQKRAIGPHVFRSETAALVAVTALYTALDLY